MLAGERNEPARLTTCGLGVGAMQLLWKCPLSDERYVSEKAWVGATLDHCPFHADGGCGLERLGTYGRVAPAGVRVPRWWCPKQRKSISLLPSFLSARLSGTLAEVEEAVTKVEEAGGIAMAVEAVRPPDTDDAVALPGALRWLRRRVAAVRATLIACVTLMPERFAGVVPTLEGFRKALSAERVLVMLRALVERYLGGLPAPVGFRARAKR